MAPQIIRSPAGEELIVLSKAEYDVMLDRLEDAADAATVAKTRAAIAAGTEILLPFEVVRRIDDDGENALQVIAEWRGSSAATLAKALDVSEDKIAALMSGTEEGTPSLWRRIAIALDVPVDLVLPE